MGSREEANKKRGKRNYVVQHFDANHLLSKEQIEIVKTSTNKGDTISFQKDEQKIEGVVLGKYKNLFTFEDGRSFTWVDYITGSPKIMDYLRMFHPIEFYEKDPLPVNLFRFKIPESMI